MKILIIAIAGLLLLSCGDMLAPTTDIPGPYSLSKIEGVMSWSLYYDIEGGAGIGRMDSVEKIGWMDNYIFAANGGHYYFLDKSKDNQYLNDKDIVKGPFDQPIFLKLLDSLKVSDFEFQVAMEK
ncbi:hypothetical protein [Flavitalea sp.]|nr:hypothetical protein [Flavitalea sp.]